MFRGFLQWYWPCSMLSLLCGLLCVNFGNVELHKLCQWLLRTFNRGEWVRASPGRFLLWWHRPRCGHRVRSGDLLLVSWGHSLCELRCKYFSAKHRANGLSQLPWGFVFVDASLILLLKLSGRLLLPSRELELHLVPSREFLCLRWAFGGDRAVWRGLVLNVLVECVHCLRIGILPSERRFKLLFSLRRGDFSCVDRLKRLRPVSFGQLRGVHGAQRVHRLRRGDVGLGGGLIRFDRRVFKRLLDWVLQHYRFLGLHELPSWLLPRDCWIGHVCCVHRRKVLNIIVLVVHSLSRWFLFHGYGVGLLELHRGLLSINHRSVELHYVLVWDSFCSNVRLVLREL